MTDTAINLSGLDVIRAIFGRQLFQNADGSIRFIDRRQKRSFAEMTRSDILLAAMNIFAKKGITNTTVQDLLDEAEVSRRTFYKYFDNKIDVLHSIYKLSSDPLLDQISVINSESQSLIEAIQQSFDFFVDYCTRLGNIMRAMQEEALNSDSPLSEHRKQFHQNCVNIFTDTVQRLSVGHIDPMVFYTLVWAVEANVLHLLGETNCQPQVVTQYKQRINQIVTATLTAEEIMQSSKQTAATVA
jgi:AcrR family transcriptional regulator